MELISHDLKIDFMGKAWIAIIISLASIIWAFYLWFHLGDAKWGVDFRGGYDMIVHVPGANAEKVRSTLESKGIEGVIVQAFKSDSDKDQYVVRFGGETKSEDAVQTTGQANSENSSENDTKKVEDFLKQDLGQDIKVLKTDYVGPAVGAELRKTGLIAVVLSLLAMLAYVSFRFEFSFGLGAVVTVFHDTITTMGFYLFAGYTINMITLAAALTIIGYSMHDNIIIFDRIREEVSKVKSFNLIDLMNRAVNETLSRTIITNSLTFLACLALYLFGGGSLADFSYYLVVGMIVGTYSSIYVACPVAVLWHRYRGGSLEIHN